MSAITRPIPLSEFARSVGLGRTTIYKQASLGKLQLSKLAGRTVIKADEAERYIRDLPRADVRQGGNR